MQNDFRSSQLRPLVALFSVLFAPAALAQGVASERELALCGRLREFPDMIESAARDYAPHAIAFYLRELAAEFHAWYNAERLLVEDEAQKQARLALAVAVRRVIANGLHILGVAAPEHM